MLHIARQSGGDNGISCARRVRFAVGVLIVMASTAGSTELATWVGGARAATADNGGAPGFAGLIQAVEPAVVSVSVRMYAASAPTSSSDALPSEPDNSVGSAPVAEGSAFFVSADGYLVTAEHVVDNVSSVQIIANDGVTYPARIVGTDTATDVAVLKIDADRPFTFVKFADQMPRVGDWVVAIGNPFGLATTATAGIVSAVGRDLGDNYDTYLQIDAPINAGDSGGPTFDLQGNVVGINDAIFAPSGGSIGIGFDIPADTARMVVAALQQSGHVTRGWLGVEVQDGVLAGTAGALITNPEVGGPAADAGIMKGDVITAVNGMAISDARGLTQSLTSRAPGSSVQLDVVRNGQPLMVEVMLGEMPTEPAQQ